MNVYRYEENPVVTPADVKPHRDDFEVIGAFNAGVAQLGDEFILLMRVAERPKSNNAQQIQAPIFHPETKDLEIKTFNLTDINYAFGDPRTIKHPNELGTFVYLTSLSYFRIARSKNGRHFTVDAKPFMYPETEFEAFGIEDPRITQIGDTFYITYSMVSAVGIGVGLASTKDFVTVTRHGMMLAPENKDVVLFPEKINGKHYVLHRPVPKSIGKPEVWIAESENLLYWGNHQYLFGLRSGAWDDGRIGAGLTPIKTPHGWLEIYHGADHNSRYCMGAILLDLNDPVKVIGRTDGPILEPTLDYEVEGFFGNVVFGCGAVLNGDVIQMYYGVADTSMACAELSLVDILGAIR